MTEEPPARAGYHRDTRRIGRYEILSGLYVGGMAELYLATTPSPGGFKKFVALKKILPDVRANMEFVRMFLDEARITAQLSHSDIAQVYDLGSEDGELYLAMEFILGLDLARILKTVKKLGKHLPVGLACMIARDVCLALHYAHRFTDSIGQPAPIVHRDITPKNLMLTFDGRTKVIDFGLALARGRLESTASGVIKGTAAYMSPEQVHGKSLDGRSDLFSLGVVMHEMLTGQRLFSGRTPSEILKRITAGGQLVSPREVNPQVPKPVSDVVMRALSSPRDGRFSTGKEMARAIEDAVGRWLFDPTNAASFMWSTFQPQLTELRALLALSTQDSDAVTEDVLIAPQAGVASTVARHKAASGEKRRITGAHSAAEATSSEPRRTKLFVVDDESATLLVVKTALEKQGFLVVGFSSARRALDQIEHERPDLVLLDVGMPEMDGFELCRRIREGGFRRQIPILFLSGACSLEERVRSLTVGGDDFLHKPVDPEELVTRVRDHLQRVAMLEELLTPGRLPARSS